MKRRKGIDKRGIDFLAAIQMQIICIEGRREETAAGMLLVNGCVNRLISESTLYEVKEFSGSANIHYCYTYKRIAHTLRQFTLILKSINKKNCPAN